MILVILLGLLWPAAGSGYLQSGGDRDLLPPDAFLGQWKKAERSRVFMSADLYGHIDGGAELFLEFGFEQLTVQNYKSGGQEIQLEVYRMTDAIAATGIYLLKCGKESRDAALGERHTINNYQLIFKRNRYFVVVNNTGGEESLRPALVQFAQSIASRLPAEESVALAGTLPQEGLVADSVRLARGPYALQAIYTLGAGDILQLQRKLAAVAGDYQRGGAKTTLIQADYPDEKAAASALSYLRKNLDDYLKIEAADSRRFSFKDFAGEYGLVSLTGKRMTIEVHLPGKPTLR